MDRKDDFQRFEKKMNRQCSSGKEAHFIGDYRQGNVRNNAFF